MTSIDTAAARIPAPNSAKSQSAAGGLIWLIGGRFSYLAITVISTAVLSRYLTPQQFGQLVPVQIVINLSIAVFDGTFGVDIIRSPELNTDRVKSTLANCLLVALILIASLLILSPLIERFFHFDQLPELVAASSVVILLRAIFVIASAVLQRERRFKEISLASATAAPFGSFLISVPLAMFGFGAWSLLLGTISVSLVETSIVARKARLPWRINPFRARLSELGSMEGFFALNQILNWAALSSANIVAGHFLSLTQLGFYSRSWRLLDIAVSATSTPMQRVLVPIFAGLQASALDARTKFEQALGIAVPGFALAGTLACLHAEAIVRALLGKQWLAAIPLVQVLFSALVARCGYKVSESLLVGFGQAKSAALRQFIYLVMLSCGALFAVRWQSYGIALSTSLAVWLFYFLSMGQAISLLQTKLLAFALIHLRAISLVIFVIAFHSVVAQVTDGLSYWPSEILRSIADGTFVCLLVIFSPRALVGDTLQRFVRNRGRLR
jgi:O-antigen/teichoic acid export membrane protein